MPLSLAYKLREFVSLLQPSADLDSAGRPDAATVYKAAVFAGVEELSQQDQQSQFSEAFVTTLRTRITIRHDANVRSNWFVQWKAKRYAILQIVDPRIPTNGVFLELWCKLIDDGLSTANQ